MERTLRILSQRCKVFESCQILRHSHRRAEKVDKSRSKLMKLKPSLPNLASLDESSKKTEIKRQIFDRLFNFVGTYGEKVLSKVLPEKAFNAIKIFSSGTKMLFIDMKEYNWINLFLSQSKDWQFSCTKLTRKQLETYLYLPGELMRVTPVLILSSFPMAQNVVFPIAMMYPNRLLSSHFYTERQQMDAYFKESEKRQAYYVSVLRDMWQSTPKDENQFVQEKKTLKEIIHHNVSPSAETILNLKPLFEKGGPLYISELRAPHVKHLMKINRVRGSLLWFPRFRLQQYANLVKQIDIAIKREDGPENLTSADLLRSCNLRGLNVKDVESEETMIEYLNNWIKVSEQLDIYAMSMLLHLPILLGYNHPSRIWTHKGQSRSVL